VKRILSLDLGSHCGWAFQSTDGAIQSGVTPFLGTLNPGHRWIRFEVWLGAWWERDPELIIYELPFVHMKHRQGLGISYGFATLLELFAAKKEIRLVGIAPTVLKMWATGHGNATKDQMLIFARSMKWDITDDNEIDARWLLEYARKRMGKKEAT
jgi:crossover junction endodeoxyribonuclease RuvC